MTNLRELAQILRVRALIAAQSGHEHEALLDLLNICMVADIASCNEGLNEATFALALRSTACLTLEAVMPQLHLRPDTPAFSTGQDLLRRFQSPGPSEWLAYGLASHVSGLQRSIERGMPLDPLFFYPLIEDEVARTISLWTRKVEASRIREWTAADVLWKSAEPPLRAETNLNLAAFFNSQWDTDTHGFNQKLVFRHDCDRLAASVLLAAALYEAQVGKPAESMEDLVPAFLPASPIDPYSATGNPFRFRKDPAGITVWSIGENLTDDGGIVTFDSTGARRQRYGFSTNLQSDIIYGAAWRNARPPAAAPVP
jgi:hypothetical protein